MAKSKEVKGGRLVASKKLTLDPGDVRMPGDDVSDLARFSHLHMLLAVGDVRWEHPEIRWIAMVDMDGGIKVGDDVTEIVQTWSNISTLERARSLVRLPRDLYETWALREAG